MKLLVCGSRSCESQYKVWKALDEIHALTPIDMIIHGCCIGPDKFAEQWAYNHDAKPLGFPANWDAHGRNAGPIRNRQMLDYGVDKVLAFWDGKSKGTKDMIARAKKAGIETVVVDVKLRGNAYNPGTIA